MWGGAACWGDYVQLEILAECGGVHWVTPFCVCKKSQTYN